MFLSVLTLALMVCNIESSSLSIFSSDDNRNESIPTEAGGLDIYAACETSFDCRRKLICTDFKCQCCKELYWNGSNCLTRKGTKQYCKSSSECMESLLCTENSCICPEKDYWNGHTCVARKLLNERCSLHFECQPTLSCARGYCQCPSSDYWNGSSCALRKIQNETCRLIHECGDTLQCKDNTCVCCEDYYWNGTFCITKKQIYSPCNSRIECAFGMYCCHGVCQLSSCVIDNEMGSAGSAFIITLTEPSQVKTQYLLINTRNKGSLSQFTFADNINKSITISRDNYVYQLPANVVMPKGLSQNGAEIYSRIPQVMYGIQMSNGAGFTEGYMAIPLQYLSTRYIFPSFKASESSITISSIYDNNKIQINLKMEKEPLTYMGVSYSNNDNITVLINKHYSLKLSHTSDLSGTMVSTSKPVSVLSSSACTSIVGGSGCNELLETVLPINQLDHTYIIPEIETRPNSSVRIFCTETTTLRVINDKQVTDILIHGQEHFEFVHKKVSYVHANNNVLVMLSAHEITPRRTVFMMTIQGRNQYLSNYHFVVPDNLTSYISVTVISDALDGLSLDSELITIRSAYNIHDGAEYYSTFSLPVTVGNHYMEHARGVRFGLWIYGQNTQCDSYGYPAGIAFKTI
ncbi:uncharacterized protein LOC143082246 [Mytilus galloprovincialis]|uniref:uncharacterized protein LOC143082246 n=1 Tax=Mytilus galloprovincialis TaxID=29158 RepID=UPI003F7C93CC